MTRSYEPYNRRHLAIGAGFAALALIALHSLDLLSLPPWLAADRLENSPGGPGGSTPLSPKLPDGRQRAFPTAEGFGAAAKGGRGGQVIFITTTAEDGDGSLRACIDAKGPRTCVFRVSGTISLAEKSLVVRNPYLTIAGETAPGDGMAIRNGPLQTRPSLEILTHDVIVRHIRLRPGPHDVYSCCSGALGLYGKDAKDIIIDHVSASWGSDETIDSENATFVTFQWGFITEPLLNGGPGKQNRARNMLLTKGGNISVHHNLFALGKFRNPQFQTNRRGSVISVVNNVIYSPVWDYVISFSDRWVPVQANVAGNYKIAGKKEKDDRLVHLFAEGGKGFSIFLADNIDETYRPDAWAAEDQAIDEEMRGFVVSEPFEAAGIRTTSALRAYDDVLVGAGATRPKRDAVDLRMVDDVRTRSGRLLKTDPKSVGGWPLLASSPPPTDEDHDGMADAWERSVGLSADDPNDGIGDLDGDGWTNFEEYLHELAGDGLGMRAVDAGGGSHT
jgi:pectate lyase